MSDASSDDREAYLAQLDGELLIGGVILSEWCSFIVAVTDAAFIQGSDLPAILTAVAAIETYLRAESAAEKRSPLADIIDAAIVDPGLRRDLHRLGVYRNRWVHVEAPWEDSEVLERPEALYQELDEMARFAVRTLRRTIYSDQSL
jgi:hypothetical protein